MAALGLNASLLSHLLAAATILLVPWHQLWPDWNSDPARLTGRKGVILIQAAFAEPEPPPAEVVEIPAADAPVVVMPQEARIEERMMVATPSSEVEMTIELAEPSRLSTPSVHSLSAKPKNETSHQP